MAGAEEALDIGQDDGRAAGGAEEGDRRSRHDGRSGRGQLQAEPAQVGDRLCLGRQRTRRTARCRLAADRGPDARIAAAGVRSRCRGEQAMTAKKIAAKKIAVLGASGYTGADAVRLLARHPHAEITVLTANTHAGKAMDAVFPHFFPLDLPVLAEWESVDWGSLDAVVCALPHGTTQEIIATVLRANPAIKVLDMSADFRLRDMATYAQWYGHVHRAPELQDEAVYGLTEFYRSDIAAARLVACPGCYPTAALLALVPLVKAGLIDAHDLVIDAKSGVTGSGRGLKQASLLAEAGEGLSPYSIGSHRHAPEIEQEIGVAAA